MAEVSVSVSLNEAALRGLAETQVAEAQQRAAARVRDLAKAEITAAGRVGVGDMRDMIDAETVVEGTTVRSRVTARAKHSVYQHRGTGIHGPSGQPIVPRRAKVLRFKPKGAQTFVFAREVEGVEPLPFLTNALARLDLSAWT